MYVRMYVCMYTQATLLMYLATNTASSCSIKGLTNRLVYVAASGSSKCRLDRINELHWKSMNSKLLSLIGVNCSGMELCHGSHLLLPLGLCGWGEGGACTERESVCDNKHNSIIANV